MNPPPGFILGSGADDTGNRPSPRKELLGPRPTALKLNKNSYKIRKPPIAPPPHHPPLPEAPPQPLEDRQPVIIYAVSPKVIHTTVSDFMGLVQRLTGNCAEGAAGNISPAARLASIEKTSPSKEREIASSSGGDYNQSSFMVDLLEDAAVELGRAPGILSPAPASLPQIPAGLFSPAGDSFMMGYNMFIPSPSSCLFSAPMVSPSPSSSSCDLFNPFFDF
ncbi:hypothetical protein CASFOL_009158 [Castilleja foliolosa]|uniref:VQ domain-containing protein n=1 Tax=Castilleja foliolosa TaxID=1961234 RepID=A0ABD3DXL7_9LAMI